MLSTPIKMNQDNQNQVIDHTIPMRQTPGGIAEIIAPFVRGRRDATWLANANRGIRNRVGCTQNCPNGQFCYPAGGEGCTPIGGKRPGQDHCCETSILQDVQFLTTVDLMKNTAIHDAGNRGPASDGYRRNFFDLVRVLTQGVQLTGPRFYWMDIDTSDGSYKRFPVLNLRMEGALQYGNLSDDTQGRLIQLGSSLFQRMKITIREYGIPLESDSPIRQKPGMFFTINCRTSSVMPACITSVARNIRVQCNHGFLGYILPTERHLFRMLRSALLYTITPVNAVLDLRYDGEGTEDFSPIVDACRESEFHGRIIAHILPNTSVQEGVFHGISFVISGNGYPGDDDEPGMFSLMFGRTLIIER